MEGVSIRVRTEALARLLADRLTAADFTARADVDGREVRVDMPEQMRALRPLLHAIDHALADQADGQARIRFDGRTYLLEPREAGWTTSRIRPTAAARETLGDAKVDAGPPPSESFAAKHVIHP